jgi:hypothetical protein
MQLRFHFLPVSSNILTVQYNFSQCRKNANKESVSSHQVQSMFPHYPSEPCEGICVFAALNARTKS